MKVGWLELDEGEWSLFEVDVGEWSLLEVDVGELMWLEVVEGERMWLEVVEGERMWLEVDEGVWRWLKGNGNELKYMSYYVVGESWWVYTWDLCPWRAVEKYNGQLKELMVALRKKRNEFWHFWSVRSQEKLCSVVWCKESDWFSRI